MSEENIKDMERKYRIQTEQCMWYKDKGELLMLIDSKTIYY